jgi:Ca-activated chloride channel family protein
MLDGRHTAIGDGMASAVNRLRESDAKSKIIILLTDGANNYGRLSPENAADAAAALGIKIYTIGAGDDHPGVPEVDEPTLRKVAKITKGRFFRARDLKSLKAVYAEIDQLEKSKIEVNQFTRYSEYSAGLIVAGLLLLLAEQLLSLSKVGRLI